MAGTANRGTSTGSPNGVHTIQMKSSSNGKGTLHDMLTVAEPSVEEALELAKQEAKEQQTYIAKLEAEKAARERKEQERKAKEIADAEERKQFEAFKALISKVSYTPKAAEPRLRSATETERSATETERSATDLNVGSATDLNVGSATESATDGRMPQSPIVLKERECSGLFGEDTNNLIYILGGSTVALVLLYLGIMALFGKPNDSMKLIFDSFPLRMFVNILIEMIAVGVGFLGLRLLFPEQYKYVHSKLNSVCSPKQDWETSSPEFRLRFASEQLWRFAFLFVLALMVIFT